jgi:segregation and condensation protein B
MEIAHLIPHIEALIFASDKPLTSIEITELVNSAFGFMEDKVNLDQVESAVDGIVESISQSFIPLKCGKAAAAAISYKKRIIIKQ